MWSECVLVFYHSNRSLVKSRGFVSDVVLDQLLTRLPCVSSLTSCGGCGKAWSSPGWPHCGPGTNLTAESSCTVTEGGCHAKRCSASPLEACPYGPRAEDVCGRAVTCRSGSVTASLSLTLVFLPLVCWRKQTEPRERPSSFLKVSLAGAPVPLQS